jgi:rod shape-determining protein MreD
MISTTGGRVLLFILLTALQVTLCDKIHLFGYATPMLYLYFILKLPGHMNRNHVLFQSALLGLCVDVFNHTLGMNMLACVVVGFFRYTFLDWFVPRDVHENYCPSFQMLGATTFLRYACAVILLHHIVLFTVESLSFFDPLALLLRIVGSAALTLFIIVAFESINFDVAKK